MPLTNNSDSLVTRNLTVEDLLALGADTPIEFQEMASPATPSLGSLVVYAKTDGKLSHENYPIQAFRSFLKSRDLYARPAASPNL